MKITTCYTVGIKNQLYTKPGAEGAGHKVVASSVDDRLMKTTADVCLSAYKYCVSVFLSEWAYLGALQTKQEAGKLSRKRAADMLIHSTKDNAARHCEFDNLYPYMPSDTRRAIIADALGAVPRRPGGGTLP